MMKRVLIVFSDQSDLCYLRLLRPGFRHCFAVVHDGGDWILYEPLRHKTVIETLPLAADYDLANWYRAKGYRVVESAMRDGGQTRLLPLFPFTCVEAIKRLIGCRKFWVWTPWQLYRAVGGKRKSQLE